MIVLQHVNSINYGLKTVTRICPCRFAYVLPKCSSYFCLLTVLAAEYRINDYVLVSRHETTFSLCGKQFVLGAWAFRLHIVICTGQAKWHAQDQRNAGKVELECFVKACFIFIEVVKN